MKKKRAPVPKKSIHRGRFASQHTDPDEDSLSLWIRHLKKSLFFTLLIGVGLVTLASLGCYFLPDPYPWIRPLSIAASMLTALLGGLICTRIHRHAALLCGLLNGSALLLCMLLLSLFLKSYAAGYSAGVSALLHLGTLLFSIAGAFLGLRRKIPSKKR